MIVRNLITVVVAFLVAKICNSFFTGLPLRRSIVINEKGWIYLLNNNKLSLSSTAEVASATEGSKEKSFIQDELRPYAMKLHTRDQAPKEGQQPSQVPVSKWEPAVLDYMRFLIDSLSVYETLEALVEQYPSLHILRNTGLERSEALKFDIQWLKENYSISSLPPVGESGLAYSAFLRALAAESIPKFLCHYYNHYFAHTAGGRMIGKRLSDRLLGGKVLRFYQWEPKEGSQGKPADGGEYVKLLLEDTRRRIDRLAAQWTPEEKQACLEETVACFRFGGSLMVYLKSPQG